MVRLTEKEEYYKFNDNDEIIRYDGRVVKDVLKELNQTEEFRLYHKSKRADLQRENEILWDILDGVRAYIKLKQLNRDYYD